MNALMNTFAAERTAASHSEQPKDIRAEYPIVLSVEPGPFLLIDPKAREIMCLRADAARARAVLLVSTTHMQEAINAKYSEYHHQIRLGGLKFTTVKSTVSEIADHYKAVTSADIGEKDALSRERLTIIRYISEAAALGASDVKFQIVGEWCRIRYKVYGRSRTVHEVKRDEGYQLVRALFNTMTEPGSGKGDLDESTMQDAQLRHDFAVRCGLKGSRISTRPAKGRGIQLTLRLQDPDREKTKDLTKMGYLPSQFDDICKMMRRKVGINILTGWTNSGKTTTLAAVMEKLGRDNNHELDIITIEDPIEADIDGDGTLQTPLTYAAHDKEARDAAWGESLRNCLRHSPNVLVPGELRDNESAVTAFNIALSGHAVWTTLHVIDVFGVIERLVGMGVPEHLVTNPGILTGLINQSLVRVLCRACKIPLLPNQHLIDAGLMSRLKGRVDLSKVYLAKPGGCPLCRHTSMEGREAACEALVPNAQLMNFWKSADGGLLNTRIFWVREQHGITKMAHAIMKIAEGRVDPRHVEEDVDALDTDEIVLGIPPCLV